MMSFQTEQRFKSAEEQVAFLTKQVKEFIVEKINLTGQLKSANAVEKRLEATIDKRDKALIEKEKYIAEKIQALQKTINEKDKIILQNETAIEKITAQKDTAIERLSSQKDVIIEKMTDAHKEALDKATERADAAAVARDGYKVSLEDLKTRHEELDVKYKAQLDTNLSQTRKLIEAQEELLKAAKAKENLEALLKKARRLNKIVVNMNPDEG